jgi:hypothetical protein
MWLLYVIEAVPVKQTIKNLNSLQYVQSQIGTDVNHLVFPKKLLVDSLVCSHITMQDSNHKESANM